MYIDTNREESNYQDDHYTSSESPYSRLKQEKKELQAFRYKQRNLKKWTWDLESDFRDQMAHLEDAIQTELGIY